MSFQKIAFTSVACLTLTACFDSSDNGSGGDNGSGSDNGNLDGNGSQEIARMDTANATSLFMESESAMAFSTLSSHAEDGDQERLYQVKDDGVVEVVTFFDHEGNEVTEQTAPRSVFPLNDEYLMVEFVDTVLLANRASGDLWEANLSMPEQSFPRHTHSGYSKGVDRDGRVFLKIDREVVVFDLEDRQEPEVDLVSLPGEEVKLWCNNADGEIIYEGVDNNDNGVIRFITREEGVKTLPGGPNNSWTSCWENFSSELTYMNSGIDVESTDYNSQTQTVSSDPFGLQDMGVGRVENGCGQEFFSRFEHEEIVLMVEPCRGILKFDYPNNDHSLITFDDLGLESIKFARAVDGHLYYSGVDTQSGNSFGRINPKTEELEEIMSGGIDVSDFYWDGDKLIVYGLDLQTTEYVVGYLDADDNFEVTERNMPSSMVRLIPLQ